MAAAQLNSQVSGQNSDIHSARYLQEHNRHLSKTEPVIGQSIAEAGSSGFESPSVIGDHTIKVRTETTRERKAVLRNKLGLGLQVGGYRVSVSQHSTWLPQFSVPFFLNYQN